MATTSTTLRQSSRLSTIFGRLALMAVIVGALIILSTPLRTINPLQLRIATNILFFVALGLADEWLLAPVLNRWPLARTAVLVVETLVLGWFFSPGRVNPVHKFLFFTHIGPFFGAVFVGALLVSAMRWWQTRRQ
ncbi:MAG: hypothetical protein CYG59_16675 [Chloroflexi bacterium]|nr:MAG: hypothetical protein CYG59_16675 [Chloroflexota bacterium]